MLTPFEIITAQRVKRLQIFIPINDNIPSLKKQVRGISYIKINGIICKISLAAYTVRIHRIFLKLDTTLDANSKSH